MTSRSWKRDSSVMMSSVRPSAKNSCSGSPLMLTSGSTAMDGFLEIAVAAAAFFGSSRAAFESCSSRARNTDAARFGEHFQTRRDVHPVAKDVVFLNDHIAKIDANAKLDPPGRRNVGVASGHPALNLDPAQHRVGDAVEFDQHAVASSLDDSAAVLGDGRID